MVENSVILNITCEPVKKRRERKQNKDGGQVSGEKSNDFVNVSTSVSGLQSAHDEIILEPFNDAKEKNEIRKEKGKSGDKDTRNNSKNFKKKNDKSSESTSKTWKVSRLFYGNPEIPEISQTAVQPIKEAVFSKKNFKDLDLHPFMVKNIEETLGLTSLTAVQEKLIPVFLRGEDALVRSQTGSGKTLAFAVPLLQMLQSIRPKISRADGIFALVIVPSRELALQIQEVFTSLVKSFAWLVPGILMGGEKRKSEKARLRKGITILTCTPGRLLDHITHTQTLSLSKVKYLILDEADRMLDLGYEKDVASIVAALDEQAPRLANKRQTVLLSATLSPGVARLAGLTLTDPTRVDTCDEPVLNSIPLEMGDEAQEALVLPDTLLHIYIVTPPKLRLVTLVAFILEKCKLEGENKIIIFMATQDMVDFYTALLTTGLDVFCSGDADLELVKLHGNMAQSERTTVFNSFRRSKSGVLICTDVASRGLDLPEVDWVVQYNGPLSVSDYVHRVGRTARRGESGKAALFLSTNEVGFLQRLEAGRVKLRRENMDGILKSLRPLCPGAHSMQEAATRLQSILEDIVAEESKMRDSACTAYTSWARFYASYPRSLKECFSVKAIHLGHFAKSFALREPPTTASQHAKSIAVPKKHAKKRVRDEREKKMGNPIKKKPQFSEFDSGLDTVVKKKKKKN